jgi:hypothetical protein
MMSAPHDIHEVVRFLDPILFSDGETAHVGLCAFPHVSQTLCGKRFSDLERLPKGAIGMRLCGTCTVRLGELAVRLI